ncbi:hypothetical protein [Providencia phage PSTRCR_120]|uniref:Uncharacterized protein n=1 Tax=Providencia phage PSTRCR_120 TaxID=2800826 RepID=A0A7U3WDW1_9CAUD|nr:hypothetical protein [Providencia phage PSTRCR_120]
MNKTKPIDNNYQLTLRGFFFACKYLRDNNVMTNDELKAFERFPYGRREDYISIVQRANKLRNEAHRKALVINSLK